MFIGFGLGFALYGPIALYGIMAIESAPSHISGTSQAIVALAANGKRTIIRMYFLNAHIQIY